MSLRRGHGHARCAGCSALQADLSQWPSNGRVQVQATTGHVLDIAHSGAHRINGEVVDYDAYPLYEAPGVEAALGTGKIRFARGDDAVEVDFDVDPNKALLPMRVIG